MPSFIPVDYNPFEDIKDQWQLSTTAEQREIFTSVQIGGEAASLGYNESVGAMLHGPCNTEALKSACLSVVKLYEILRSTFSDDGMFMQIHRKINIDIPVLDFTDLNETDSRNRLKHFTKREVEIPFNLKTGPLIRFAIIRLKKEMHLLSITAHHLICDGWSIGIMLQEISRFYTSKITGAEVETKDAIQFREYAEAQNQYSQTRSYKDNEQFWINQYSESVPVMDLPIYKKRPAIRTFNADRIDFNLEANTIADLKKLSSKSGASFFAAMLSAFEIFLYRITQQNDIVVGLPASGQNASGMFRLIGHCVHFLPLRARINPSENFSDYLKQRKKYLFDALDHQRFTFGDLIPKLNIERDPSRIPVAPVAFNIDVGMLDGVHFANLQCEFVSNPRRYENFELNFNISGAGNNLVLEVTYNTDLFNAETIRLRVEEFEQLLKSIIQNPEQKVSELNIIPHQEFKKIVFEWNSDKIEIPQGICVHELFEKQVAANPDKTALEFDGEKLSYSELNLRANKLAHHLRTHGAESETVCGIYLNRSVNMVIAMLAVFKSDAAYIPMDPVYPPDRVMYMLNDVKAPMVITTKDLAKNLNNYNGKIILLDEHTEIIKEEDDYNPVHFNTPANLAYILYTSGSTGKPKGVMIEHGNIVALLEWGLKLFPKEDLNGAVANASFNFDISVFEIFLPLVGGGRLILLKNALAISDLVKEQNATLAFMVPSAMSELLKKENGIPDTLKTVYLGGEYVPQELVNEICDNTQIKTIYDFYGPTECTIISTYTQRFKNGISSIGKPISNYTAYIVDSNMQTVGIGITGELLIGGAGVGRGYYNNTLLTSEKFIPDPFLKSGNLYRTGDAVRWLPDGRIEYIGRIDSQVKIRGYRIELGEIESQLTKHDAIKEVAVVVREDVKNDKRLAAYIVYKNGSSPDTAELKNYLSQELPDYMIPSAFVVLNKLPLTPNGKIDRKQLPVPEMETRTESANFEEPNTPIESMLTGIWCDILSTDKIGIHDSFFEMGGHSLLGIRMVDEIKKKMGIKLEYPVLFRASTIHQLAKVINNQDLDISWPIIVPLQPNGNRPPLFCIHMHNGNIQRWRVLNKFLGNNQPVYAIQPRGLDEKQPFHTTIEEMAQFYLDEIKKIQPSGPYNLLGTCFGGMVTFEISRLLEEQGEKVHFAGMINNYAPPENPMQYRMMEMLNTFMEMDFSKKVGFALEKTKNAGRKVLAMVLGKKVDNASGEIVVGEAKRPDIRYIHTVALLNYKPKSTYNGNITLIRTGEETASHYNEQLGWDKYIKGKLTIEFVPESDNDTIVTEEKYYSQLAAIVKKGLES